MRLTGDAERPLPDALAWRSEWYNALKHGRYTGEAISHRRKITDQLRAMRSQAKALLEPE